MKIKRLIFCLIPAVFFNGCTGIFDEINTDTDETSSLDAFPIEQQIKPEYSANKTDKHATPALSMQSENTNTPTGNQQIMLKRGNVVFNQNQTYCTGESNNSRMKKGKPPFDVNCEIIKLVYSNENNMKSVVMAYSEHRNHGYDKVYHRWSAHEIQHESNTYNSDYWKTMAMDQKYGLQKEADVTGEKYSESLTYTDKKLIPPLHSNAVTAATNNPKNNTARTLEINLPTTVSYLTSKLGKYDAVNLPSPNKNSPWGQLFEWKRNDGTSFYALGDDYNSTDANQQAAVKYIELDGSAEKNALDIFNGLSLNKSTKDDVGKNISDVKINKSEFTGVKGGRGKSALYYQENGVFTYLFFDIDGLLVGIGRSTFYINQAGAA